MNKQIEDEDKELSDEELPNENKLEELNKIEEAYRQLRWDLDERMGW